MARDIGIDLGTTFSVLAVRGKLELAADYPEGEYYEEWDVTIIPSPLGDKTFPSVMWAEPESPDELNFGIEAKQKAAEGSAPIMFSKRKIGTDELFKLNGREYSARAVATRFLKYLKECAESAIGEPVHRAVITHPAYFDRNQVHETREAAEDAGFDMKLPEQMFMEPSAAAVAYTNEDDRDPLRILTYDLGGGTFDVTVLERRQGVIDLKSFDGDHLLGGYNFDKTIRQWILDSIKERGRTIPFDEDNAEDRGTWARLLLVAEKIKEDLTLVRTDKVPVPVKVDFLKDEAGIPVQFVDKINREQFTALIQEDLQTTVECCQRALDKAEMTADELDEVLLVGGSTYGPWVKKSLSGSFPISEPPYHPDLCVAAGAAIKASELPIFEGGEGVNVTLDIPASSALPVINIEGELTNSDGLPFRNEERGDYTVIVVTPEGASLDPVGLNEKSRFLIKDLQLEEEESNTFTVKVLKDEQFEVYQRAFSVQHEYEDSGGSSAEIHPRLPRSLYIEASDGMVPVASEGETLPAKCPTIRLRKNFDGSDLRMDVYQESEAAGAIVIEDIPEDAGENSIIELDVEVTQHNVLKGTAKIKTRTGTDVKTWPVSVRFPPTQIPALNELDEQFRQLSGKREEIIALSQDPEERTAMVGKGGKLVKKLEALFNEQEKDRQVISEKLKELNLLVSPPPDDMNPSRKQFRNRVAACQELLASAPEDPKKEACRTILNRSISEGEDAALTKNHKRWANVNERLVQVQGQIEAMVFPPDKGGEQELPPTPILKDSFLQDLSGTRAQLAGKRDELLAQNNYELRWKKVCDKMDWQLDGLESEIIKIDDDMEPKQALGQLQLIGRKVKGLSGKVQMLGKDVRRVT